MRTTRRTHTKYHSRRRFKFGCRTETHNCCHVLLRLCARVLPRIPLIEDLTTGPIPHSSFLLVEFTGASQWYNASFTISAGWLKTGGGPLGYNSLAHPPDDVRSKLNELGLNCEQLESEDKLYITDLYTATLGQKSKEKIAIPSLKVADLSIEFSRNIMRGPPEPDTLAIVDNGSTLARFNDEKNWVEFILTRIIPSAKLLKNTGIAGIIREIHSAWVYEQLEAAADGIIDFSVEEEGKTLRDVMRIRSMRNAHFDREWHELKIGENFEITLEK